MDRKSRFKKRLFCGLVKLATYLRQKLVNTTASFKTRQAVPNLVEQIGVTFKYLEQFQVSRRA